MDYHPGFATNTPEMLRQEDALLSSADLVVVSSPVLEKDARRHTRRGGDRRGSQARKVSRLRGNLPNTRCIEDHQYDEDYKDDP
jgi:hypothetical protein